MPEDRIEEPTLRFRDEECGPGYYVQAPSWFLRHKGITWVVKALYLVLLSYTSGGHTAYPGQERLMEEIGIGESSLRAAINTLVSLRLMTVTRRGLGLTNVYELYKLPVRASNLPKTKPADPRETRVQTLATQGSEPLPHKGELESGELESVKVDRRDSSATPTHASASGADPNLFPELDESQMPESGTEEDPSQAQAATVPDDASDPKTTGGTPANASAPKKRDDRAAEDRKEESVARENAGAIFWPLYAHSLGLDPDAASCLTYVHYISLSKILREACQGDVIKFRWACKWFFSQANTYGKSRRWSVPIFVSQFPECVAGGEELRRREESQPEGEGHVRYTGNVQVDKHIARQLANDEQNKRRASETK